MNTSSWLPCLLMFIIGMMIIVTGNHPMVGIGAILYAGFMRVAFAIDDHAGTLRKVIDDRSRLKLYR